MGAELQINNTLLDQNIFIKGRFKSGTQNLYGLFLVMFAPDGSIQINNIIASSFSSLYDTSHQAQWNVIEDAIIQCRWKGTYNQNITNALISQVEKLKQDTSYKTQIYDAAKRGDFATIQLLMYDLINRILHDKNVYVEIDTQFASYNEIQQVKQERANASNEATQFMPSKNSVNLEKNALIINGSLILSPVKGKPLYDLKIGDKIILKVEPTTQIAQQFVEMNKLKVENRIRPIPGEVVDVKAESRISPVEVLCRVDTHMYVKCIEDERQVKLRMYDPRIDGQTLIEAKKAPDIQRMESQRPEQIHKEGLSASVIAFIIVAVLILFVLLAAIYFII